MALPILASVALTGLGLVALGIGPDLLARGGRDFADAVAASERVAVSLWLLAMVVGIVLLAAL